MIPLDTLNRIVELGVSAKPQTVDGGDPFVVIPMGMKTESLAHLAPPKRIKQSPKFLDCSSFTDYVNKFKSGETLIFARVTETSAEFVAVLDYHAAKPKPSPAYCHHTASFATLETPEWKTWLQANRVAMDQVAFATWLEDNQQLFVEPAGADLLELVKSLHGHKNARFNTALRLDNGSYSVGYEEEVVVRGVATAKSGEVELPAIIKTGIAPFQGASNYEVTARLKTRVQDRKLMLWFETIALHVIVRDSILLLTKQISDKTGIVPLLGTM